MSAAPLTVKCDRYDICDARMEKLEQEKREDHRAMWEEMKVTSKTVSDVNTSLAKLEGKIAGAVWAAGAVGALVGAVVGIMMQLLKGTKL